MVDQNNNNNINNNKSVAMVQSVLKSQTSGILKPFSHINIRGAQESVRSNWSRLIPTVAVHTCTTQQDIVLLEMNSHSLKCTAGGVEEELTRVHISQGLMRKEQCENSCIFLFLL